jgi:uroporphyrinogen decarboxylase
VNSLERVIAALKRDKLPDRVPYLEWGIDKKVINKINRGSSYEDFIENSIMDGVVSNAVLEEKRNYIDNDNYIDEWGVKRRRSPEDIWYPVDAPLKQIEKISEFVPPDPTESYRFKTLEKHVAKFKGKKAIIYFINDAYSIPSRLRGVERFLIDFIENPNIIRELVKISVEYNCQLAEYALSKGADIIASGDDYAFNSGCFFSPQFFKEYIVEGLAKVIRTVHENGGYFIKHTDGNINRIFESILSTGIDAINPIEPKAGMDLEFIKKKFGGNICIMGNVDCGNLLTFGTEAEVIQETKACIDIAAPGGGYILSSSNSIHSSVKPENFLAMIKTVEKYGYY